MVVRPALWAWLAFAVLVGLAAPSAGAATVTLSHFPPDPGVLPGGGWQFRTGTTFAQPTPPRAWVNGVYGSVPKIVATDTLTLAGKAGPLVVQAAQRVGIAEAAGAVARCLAASTPVCAAATAAATAYASYRYFRPSEHAGSPACAEAELCFDPGTAETQETQYCISAALIAGTHCASTVGGAVQAHVAAYNAGAVTAYNNCPKSGSWVCTLEEARVPNPTPTGWQNVERRTRTYDYTQQTAGFSAWGFWQQLSASSTEVTTCPASIDASNPAYNVPAGQAKGPDGKCPTARYNHQPATPAQAAAKVAAYPGADPGLTFKEPLREAIDTGGQQVPAEIEVSGPASQTGTPTTTTTTNGTGTTTTTTAPTYNYSYGGDTINTTTTVTTNTCVGAGACSSSNATETKTTTEDPAGADPKDPCTNNPDRAGCARLGQPTTPDLPTQSVNATAAPEGGWGADNAACPAPRVLDVLGQAVTVDNSLVCQFMSGIRFAIIGVCGVIAAFVFVGGLRS